MFKNKNFIFGIIVIACALIDQGSKFIIDNTLALYENLLIIPNVLSFEKVYNTGAAFSILQNNTVFLVLIAILTIISILIFLIIKKNNINSYENIAFGFICAGALGNLIDRICFSYVIDFIRLDFIDFPIFNIADILINIGVIILIVNIFVQKNDK